MKLAVVKAWLHVIQANLLAGITSADEPAVGTTDLVSVAVQMHLYKCLQLPGDSAHCKLEAVPLVVHMLLGDCSAAEKQAHQCQPGKAMEAAKRRAQQECECHIDKERQMVPQLERELAALEGGRGILKCTSCRWDLLLTDSSCPKE